jgi:hypothetical protein
MSEYRFKEHEKRVDNHIPASDPIIFYEISLGDASEFKGKLKIRGTDVEGYKILRTEAPAVPNAIAGLLLHLREPDKQNSARLFRLERRAIRFTI